jgi:biopolymer transport protein ExbD
MAEIQGGGGGGHGKHDKKRAKKQSTRVDMTPMVDLAFLLLTFFVLTSTFSKPKVLRMIFPEKLNKNEKQAEVKDGLTIILSADNKVFYYRGSTAKLAREKKDLDVTDFSKNGLRKMLTEYNYSLLSKLTDIQKRMDKLPEADTASRNKLEREAKDAQKASREVIIVKNDEGASYRNMIDLLDEFMITQIAKFVVADEEPDKVEKDLIKKQKGK